MFLSKVSSLPPCSLPFTAETIRAIQEAHGSAYHIRIFEKEMRGRPSGCVLVGEGHFKRTDHVKKMGQNLVDHFHHHGIEGIAIDSFGHRLLDGIALPISWLLRLLSRGYSTTREQARLHYFLQDKKALRSFIDKHGLLKIGKRRLQALRFENKLGRQLNGWQIVCAWRRLMKNPPSQSVHRLEAGHQWDAFDQISSCILPFSTISALAGMAVIPFAPELVEPATEVMKWLVIGLLVSFGGTFVSIPIPETSPWKRRIDLAMGAVLHGRNLTMAGNINSLLTDDLPGESLLAVMGRTHTRGVAALLQKRYGFREVALPFPA